MPDETVAEIQRNRDRLKLVTALLAEEQGLPEQANPHAQQALAELAKSLRAERGHLEERLRAGQGRLVEELLSAVLNALNSKSRQVAEALGMDDQQAESYRLSVVIAVQRRREKLDRLVSDIEWTEMYDKAFAEQERLLRWIEQAKGEPA